MAVIVSVLLAVATARGAKIDWPTYGGGVQRTGENTAESALGPSTVGGLAPLEAGYRRILVAPQPGGDLEWAETSLDTPHGTVSVRWDLDDGELRIAVTVPEGAEAVLRLPGADDEGVGPGRHHRSVAYAAAL